LSTDAAGDAAAACSQTTFSGELEEGEVNVTGLAQSIRGEQTARITVEKVERIKVGLAAQEGVLLWPLASGRGFDNNGTRRTQGVRGDGQEGCANLHRLRSGSDEARARPLRATGAGRTHSRSPRTLLLEDAT
jgi:hypothetical protein